MSQKKVDANKLRKKNLTKEDKKREKRFYTGKIVCSFSVYLCSILDWIFCICESRGKKFSGNNGNSHGYDLH